MGRIELERAQKNGAANRGPSSGRKSPKDLRRRPEGPQPHVPYRSQIVKEGLTGQGESRRPAGDPALPAASKKSWSDCSSPAASFFWYCGSCSSASSSRFDRQPISTRAEGTSGALST